MLTVIIPTFNRSRFLVEAVESVLGQTAFAGPAGIPFELIVVDDGSTDSTAEVMARYKDQVRYDRREHRGVSAARNRGLLLASGESIAFLDSDDLWMKDKIAAQMSYLKARPGAVMCSTEEIWVRNGVRVNPRPRHGKPEGRVFQKFLPLCLLSLSAAVFRREVFETIGVFDEDLPACEDYDFALRLAHKYPVHLLPRPLTIKRGGHSDQLSRCLWGMDRFRVRALEKALTLPLTPQEAALVRGEIIHKCGILVQGFSRRGKADEAEKYREIMDRCVKR